MTHPNSIRRRLLNPLIWDTPRPCTMSLLLAGSDLFLCLSKRRSKASFSLTFFFFVSISNSTPQNCFCQPSSNIYCFSRIRTSLAFSLSPLLFHQHPTPKCSNLPNVYCRFSLLLFLCSILGLYCLYAYFRCIFG